MGKRLLTNPIVVRPSFYGWCSRVIMTSPILQLTSPSPKGVSPHCRIPPSLALDDVFLFFRSLSTILYGYCFVLIQQASLVSFPFPIQL
ncbi:hypothetical protein BDV10DRAFT_108466 [Aspergillus recurvatus]